MAIFSIDIGRSYTPPTVSNNSDILNSKLYTYKLADFNKDYFDREGDALSLIKFIETPSIAGLTYLGVLISPGKTFSTTEIVDLKYKLPSEYAIYNGVLYQFEDSVSSIILQYEAANYKLLSNVDGVMTFGKDGREFDTQIVEGTIVSSKALDIKFTVIDASEKNNESEIAVFSLVPQGNINVVSAYSNQPPVVTDFTVNTGHAVDYDFTKSIFSDNYSDVENDAPVNAIIATLPGTGVLKLGTSVITAGQEITFSDLDNLIYTPDNNTTTAYNESFTFKIKDAGSDEYSNIGRVTINVSEKVADAPIVLDNSAILNSNLYTFSTPSFTNSFADGDGDSHDEVIIRSLPKVGVLKLLGANAVAGTKFKTSNSSGLKYHLPKSYAIYDGIVYRFSKDVPVIISDYEALGYKLTNNYNGKLTFTDLDNPSDKIIIDGVFVSDADLAFTFRTTDNSTLNLESNTAQFSFIPQGNVNVIDVYVNNPPVVGDNTVSTKYDAAYVFDRSDFVEDTDPRFQDPEGDQPYKLKIITLPLEGELLYDGQSVATNDIYDFIGGIDEEKLIYRPNINRTDITDVTFRFAVSDTGSKTFVE